MPLPHNGVIDPVRIVDGDGNPARVALTDVYRLSVDAVIGGGGGVADTRNADADDDFAAALIGLVTNSRLAIFDVDTASWERWDASRLDSVSGAGLTTRFGAFAVSFVTGVDNTGAAVLRPVEARNFDAQADIAQSLIGLTTNSRLAGYLAGTDWRILTVTRDPANTGTFGFLNVTPTQESGFVASNAGRRFAITHQTAGTEITAQATFVATTPTLLLYNSAGNTSIVILRSILIQIALATATSVKVTVMIDPDDRFSAGGTTVTPQNTNEGSAVAYPGTAFRFNATATAADADERIVFNGRIPAGLDQSLEIEFEDSVIINGVGSILVYIYDDAGLVAPTLEFNLDVEAF